MTTNTEHSKVLIIGSRALPATPPPFMQPALT